MKYLLDTNVFIEAKNRHYGFDFCPAFWSWLDEANADRRVHSIHKVKEEILEREDELTDWARPRGDGFFLPPDVATLVSLATVSTWVTSAAYESGAVSTFLQAADYFLAAAALANSLTVVTHEVRKNSVRIIKIPDACLALEVQCISPFEMLRIERATFTLGATR
jgi:hypothetical protein